MDLKLKDKVVLVTGGAKGIGGGVVRTFAEESAKVVIVDRDVDAGLLLVEELLKEGKEAHFQKADLLQDEDCEAAVKESVQKYGRLDVIVNNAGVNDGVSLSHSPKEFMSSLHLNVFHCFSLVHHALKELKKNKGNIINIGSKVCVTGQGGTSGYAASKGAINGLTREWALDLCEDGVRVNAVIPAEVYTPQYQSWAEKNTDTPEALNAMLSNITKNIPFERRFTKISEIADMVVFLASERSAHTTGQIVHVDGGYVHFDRTYTK